MHTKKYIDNLFSDVLYNMPCKVALIKLTVNDIQNSKLSILNNGTAKKVDTKFKGNRISKADKTDSKYTIISLAHKKYQGKKKSPAEESRYKKLKLCTNKIDVVKLVSSRKGKTDTPKNKGKTLKKVKTSRENTKFIGNKTFEANTNNKKKSKGDKMSKENTNIRGNTNFKVDIQSVDKMKPKADIKYLDKKKSTAEESNNKKLKLCTDKIDVGKLVLSRKVKSDTTKKSGKILKKNKTSKNEESESSKNNLKKDKIQDNNKYAEVESSNKKLKLCKDKMDFFKLVLSEKGETDTLQKNKIAKNVKISKTYKKTETNIKTSNENTNFNVNKTPKIDTLFKGNKILKTNIKPRSNCTYREEEYPNKRPMLSKDKIDISKFTLSREVESDTSKEEVKTFKSDTMFNGITNLNVDIKSLSLEKKTYSEKESTNKNLKLSKDKIDVSKFTLSREVESDTSKEEGDTVFKDNTNFNVDIKSLSLEKNTYPEEESTKQKLMLSKDKIDVSKFTLSREVESDISKEEGKTFESDTTFKGITNFNVDIKSLSLEKNTYSEEESPNKNLKLSKDKIDVSKFTLSREVESDTSKEEGDTMFKDKKHYKTDIKSRYNCTFAEEENPNKKLKLYKDENDVVIQQHILFREGGADTFKSQFKAPIRPSTEIASTNTEKRPIVTDRKETAKSKNPSVKNVIQRIRVIEPVKMMTKNDASRWNKMEYLNKLSTIEKLYAKYFTKSIQDTIVTIANILNIISISNKYHQTRIDESFKKRSAAEKLKECCDADQLHEKHKTTLETKLKSNFINVLSVFTESEFDSAFQMFFLSILNVLLVLDQDSFKLGGVFKKLVRLLRNSLKNSKFNHPKIFSMFRSKKFKTDCVDKITVIEDCRIADLSVVDRMELFFISTAISRKYFQGVINAVTSDSDEDLSILIDNATLQCCIHSKFKDHVDLSTVQQSNDKIPITNTNQTPANSVETNKNRFIGNNPNEVYQQMPVLSVGQTIVNAAVKPLIGTRDVPITSNTSMMQFTTLSSEALTSTPTTGLKMSFKPSPLFKEPVLNMHLQNAVGSTVEIENKKYTLIKEPLGPLRAVAVANSTNILVQSPSTADIKCIARNCKNSVNVMCSRCKIAKYCDTKCLERDWYDRHVNHC